MDFRDNISLETANTALRECKTIEEVKSFINVVMSDWIVSYHNTYSMDYPYLINNFIQVCKRYKTEPKGIVLVRYIPGENDLISEYRVLTRFLDVMAANGFCVRRQSEFFPCKKCDCLIPVRPLYSKLKFTSPESVPSVWIDTCKKCV